MLCNDAYLFKVIAQIHQVGRENRLKVKNWEKISDAHSNQKRVGVAIAKS